MLIIEVSKALLVRVNEKFPKLKVRVPMIHSDEDGHVFLFVGRQSLILGPESSTEKGEWPSIL